MGIVFSYEEVETGSIPPQVRPKPMKIGIHNFLAWLEGIRERV